MHNKIERSWHKRLKPEFSKAYFRTLIEFIASEYQAHTIYPSKKEIFNALMLCPFNKVHVVILGQDPYHGIDQAHGLSFSVRSETKIPPSLKNIFKEIKNDLNQEIPENGNLERWAVQGVLLLNATLTVKAGQPTSHQNKGWEQFTDTIIQVIAEQKENVVFLLWGASAHKKAKMIDKNKHLILTAVHPSPLSAYRGFLGCQHFSKANNYLEAQGFDKIEW